MALSKIQVSSMADNTIHGRRNLVIGGCMRIAQRGTSFTLGNASAKYPVDRFFVQDVNSSSGEATVSQSTTAPADFKNSLKIDVTTADTSLASGDQYKIEYRIEGQDIAHLNFGTSSAQTVTLSFYIRSNKTGNTSVALLNSANDRAYVATFTIDSANTWERKEITIAGDQSGTWLDTNGIGLRLRWGSFGSTFQTSSVNQWQANQVMSTDSSPINFFDSTDNELYITGVQLEVGSQATPFEHRSFGEELSLCQRYYEKSYNYGISPGTGSTDGWQGYDAPSGTSARFRLEFKTSKRGTPTMTTYHHSTGASGVMYTSSNGTQNTTVSGIGNNRAQVAMASGTLSSNAEVGCQWTADSEL